MRIAYVTTHDARDPKAWSGTTYHIAKSLEAQGAEIQYIGPLKEVGATALKVQQLLYSKVFGKALERQREPRVLDGYARQIEAQLEHSNADVILSPGTIPIAHLNTRLPIVTWTDATFGGIVDEYRWQLPVSKRSRRLGNAQEQRALGRVNLAIFASDWAAKSAVDLYGIDPAKVKVIPFGANTNEFEKPDDAMREKVIRAIHQRPTDRLTLLFAGTGWQRKGGDIAVEVARQLNERGLPTELQLLGADPPADLSLPPFVKRLGYIDKQTPEGRRRFEEIFERSHFLILPARAEAFGVVLCEANRFGVPCLASGVGGIPTIVRNDENGMLLDYAKNNEIAEIIRMKFSQTRDYRTLAATAFEAYQKRLNWYSSARLTSSLVKAVIR